MREQLAIEIRRLLKSVRATAIIVTHDQQEAFAVADKIAVMQAGRLHQYASASALYHQPASTFVASFIGEGVFVPATCLSVTESNQPKNDQHSGVLSTPLGKLEGAEIYCAEGVDLRVNGDYQLLVRPDDIIHDDESHVTGTITDKRFRGANILYQLCIEQQSARHQILCLAPSHHDHNIGEGFGIRLNIEHAVLFST